MAKGKKALLLSHADTTLSQLNYAVALQVLAAKVGFDWPNVAAVADKIQEELAEVLAETTQPDNHERLQDEIGDLLFACTNLARHLNVDPEKAIAAGNLKFQRRFNAIEQHILKQNKTLSDFNTDELNQFWQDIKAQE